MKSANARSKSDWIGILGSFACLVHCVALPAFLYLFQITVGTENRLLDYVFATIAIGAVSYSIRSIHSSGIRVLLLVSLALLLAGVFLEHKFPGSITFLHIGSVGLIVGHALNLRNHRRTTTAAPVPKPTRVPSPARTSTPVPVLRPQ